MQGGCSNEVSGCTCIPTPSDQPVCLFRPSVEGGCVVFSAVPLQGPAVDPIRVVGDLSDGWLLVLAREPGVVILSRSVVFSATMPGESHLMIFVVLAVMAAASGNGPVAVGRMVPVELEGGAELVVGFPEGCVETIVALTLVCGVADFLVGVEVSVSTICARGTVS